MKEVLRAALGIDKLDLVFSLPKKCGIVPAPFKGREKDVASNGTGATSKNPSNHAIDGDSSSSSSDIKSVDPCHNV